MMSLAVTDYRDLGGRLIRNAKPVTINAVGTHYPQHYYTYHQTAESLSNILSLIKAPAGFLLFSGHDHHGLYIQVGIIGQENYVRQGKPDIEKLVYGRKWRIDTDTPTTEIVQTTLLAVQKVREHEVRELLSWTDPQHGSKTTPFSCHQDINLLTLRFAHNEQTAAQHCNEAELQQLISQLRLGSRSLQLLQVVPLGAGRLLVEVSVDADATARDGFADLAQAPISVVLPRCDAGYFLHGLMDSIIQLSHVYCQQHFTFCGVARFARQIDPRLIAEVSRQSRPYKQHLQDQNFAAEFERVNAAVDQQRAPHIGTDMLGHINRKLLAKSAGLGGFMPTGYIPEI